MIGCGQRFLDRQEGGCVEYGQTHLVQRPERKSKLVPTTCTKLYFLMDCNSIFTFMTGQNLHGGTVQPR